MSAHEWTDWTTRVCSSYACVIEEVTCSRCGMGRKLHTRGIGGAEYRTSDQPHWREVDEPPCEAKP